jgi:hypothetical protein
MGVAGTTGMAGGLLAPGLWDDADDSGPELPDPGTELESGRAALESGDVPAAAIHLALALRLAPGVAPAVLELLEAADGPELALVRGDAYRLVGHERDARLAFASAAAAVAEPIDKETT